MFLGALQCPSFRRRGGSCSSSYPCEVENCCALRRGSCFLSTAILSAHQRSAFCCFASRACAAGVENLMSALENDLPSYVRRSLPSPVWLPTQSVWVRVVTQQSSFCCCTLERLSGHAVNFIRYGYYFAVNIPTGKSLSPWSKFYTVLLSTSK